MIVREMTYNDIASVADVDKKAFPDAWKTESLLMS